MKPRADTAFFAHTTSLSQHHPGHLQSNDSLQAAPVVNYRGVILRDGLLGKVFILRSPSMSQKPILVPTRLRRPPATGWSWMDRLFVREHMAHLSREAVLLYFFLAAVADKHGLSFYADGTLATLLRMTLPALIQARNELLDRDLIAHEARFTQVLSLLPPGQRRRSEPGQGLMQLGEILRRAAELPHSTEGRILP
jgi:hypothetical protein